MLVALIGVAEAGTLPTRRQVIATFDRYVELNNTFLAAAKSGQGQSGKSYTELRGEVETYAEGPYNEALVSARDLICKGADAELLRRLFNVVLVTSNSASEAPAWTLGRIFLCRPGLVQSEFKRLPDKDQRALYGKIEFGFENVIYGKPEGDQRVARLRTRLRTMAPRASDDALRKELE